MRRLVKKRSSKSGLPPGTLVHVGEQPAASTRVLLMHYDESGVTEREIDSVADGVAMRTQPGVTWIHLVGASQTNVVQEFAAFGLHPLVLEDIVNTDQRTKFEDYGPYAFIVLKLLHAGHDEISAEQVSIVLGDNFVISVEEAPGNAFEPVRAMIRNDRGQVRRNGADYLAYLLLDSVVDGHFGVIEALGERIETLQDQMIDRATPKMLQAVHRLRREMLIVRKSLWPLRAVLAEIERLRPRQFREGTWIYLRDVYDHTIHIVDNVETYREMLSSMIEIYLSSATNRLNEIIKVLTVISTIFIPSSFIASVYGMNFQYMPELSWRWGYPAVWAVMVGVTVGLLVYLRRKRWL